MPRNIIVSCPKAASARVLRNGKPDLPKWLFWDTSYEVLDWKWAYLYVIGRVIDRGNDQEFEALMRYYGRKKVIRTLRFEVLYLMDHSIERACAYFKLRPEELRCYMRKRSRGGYWI
jgi:hypothetical protein